MMKKSICLKSFNIHKSIENKGIFQTFNKGDKLKHKRAWVDKS